MSELMAGLEFWHWLAIGLLFIVGEILFSGFFLLWLGLGGMAVGLIMLVAPELAWQGQLGIFAVISFSCLFLWRRFGRNPEQEDHPNLNQRGAQYVGRTFTLDADLSGGQGKMRVGDSPWSIRGPDLPAGSRVKVVGVDSNVLIVEADGDAAS